MSEYQYIAFRAVDRPLTDAELRFAQKQSTRAEITRWSFTNEYEYGEFRGDVDGLLCSGYEVHLHYANFGVRRVALRLPGGMPFSETVWQEYTDDDGFGWKPDTQGGGGILDWAPFHDAGSLDEIWDPKAYVEDCVGLRQRLIDGDLRALYIIWLCATYGDYGDWAATEPPVPLGLEDFSEVAKGVLEFFGIDPLILVAASEGIPPLSADHQKDEAASVEAWIGKFVDADLRRRLLELMSGDPTAVKAKLLAEYRDQVERVEWPTVPGTRSFETLRARAKTLCDEEGARMRAELREKALVAERERQKRIKTMAAAPKGWLAEAERLANARGVANYEKAASILADLREAIGGEDGTRLARDQAAALAKKHPTLTRLKRSLRERGLLA